MRAKAKSSSTPYPIWIEGEYITEPPIRPSDGAVRPAGHYIDEGGYPGANVYEIDINTMCRQTDAADRFRKTGKRQKKRNLHSGLCEFPRYRLIAIITPIQIIL